MIGRVPGPRLFSLLQRKSQELPHPPRRCYGQFSSEREATLVLSHPINVLAAFAAFAFVGAVLLGMF